MSLDFDRQALVSIFTAEAADGLAKLSSALASANGIPSSDAVHQLFIIAHSLKGASALYGYDKVSSVVGILEQAFEQVAQNPHREWGNVAPFARELVERLQQQVELIRQSSEEGDCQADDLIARYPEISRYLSSGDIQHPDDYLMPDLDAEVFSYFVPEAQEYLETITSSLLALERDPEEVGELQRLFRAVHTLKGSAYTVGFQAIGDLTHELEDIVDAVLDGETKLSGDLTDHVFRALDTIRALLARDAGRVQQTRQEFQQSLSALRQVHGRQTVIPSMPTVSAAPAGLQPAVAKPVRRRAAPRRKAAPLAGHGDDSVIRVRRDRLERLLNLVGELVIGRSRLEQRLMLLEQLSRQVLNYEGKMLQSVRAFEEKHAFSSPEPTSDLIEASSLLMDFGALEFDKYDDFNILARSMGEVSADIAESMAQLSGMIRHGREDMSRLHELTLGLRDEIAQARMVPISTLFTRFQKATREMGRTAGKSVDLEITGGEIEVDTDMVQRLVDPIIHIVRNAVYHGIETPEVREAAGKPVVGTVKLNAAHQGPSVVIEIKDDGAGLDTDKITAKAVSLGVLKPEEAAAMSPTEAAELIYLPGFSTAGEVGDQAGRGVGMDVVKQAVENLNGEIDMDWKAGIGTTFTIRLPLTMLISAALIVRVGQQRYALPLPGIREVLATAGEPTRQSDGRMMIQSGDDAIELRSLAEVLSSRPESPRLGAPVIVLQAGPRLLAVTVDELLGRQEIVIKTLGPLSLFRTSTYSGAAVDPQGRIILTLDVARLITRPNRARKVAVKFGVVPPVQSATSSASIEQGKKRILLIDDSLSVRKFIGRMLEGAGYHVDTAIDGEEGLRKAAAEDYHLIITDLEMPKMNGYEVIQSIRESKRNTNVPLLVMTTRAGEKHRQVAMTVGATAYLPKPIQERMLIDEVSHWIGEAAGVKS